MGLFNDFSISGSGMHAYRKWMDALSDNIANINTATNADGPAFQERFVQVQAANVNGSGGGVVVNQVKYGDTTGRLVYDPQNPVANKDGYVKQPDIDLSTQMTNLIVAQRAYQANVNAMERAKSAYQQALTLGK